MKTSEEITKKAYDLGKKYFPDEWNVWARDNIEAKYVSSACQEMAEWLRKEMIEKACEWFRNQKEEIGISWFDDYEIRFREAMEE